MNAIDELLFTSMPLDYFRRVFGIDPYHFWQMKHTDHPLSGCSEVYTHYRYWGRGPSRSDLLQAIMEAEALVAQVLEFWIGPKYEVNEIAKLIAPKQYSTRLTPHTLRTRWGHVREVGLRTLTLINDNVALTYDATDNVTLTVATDVTDPCEVVCCYKDTLIPIRPIDVSISGGNATITIKKWLCGLPSDWEESGNPIDANVAANLIVAVDVYREWYDPSSQVLLAWEPDIHKCGCLQNTCAICVNATQAACGLQGDFKYGLIAFQAGTWNAVTSEWDQLTSFNKSTHFPDFAYVSYAHGLTDGCYMSMRWARIVSHLAVTLLEGDLCGCSNVQQALRYWREDLGASNDDLSHALSPSGLSNPFGHGRGGLKAWEAVKQQLGD